MSPTTPEDVGQVVDALIGVGIVAVLAVGGFLAGWNLFRRLL